MNIYLVISPANQSKYEVWHDLIVIAESEDEAKKINYPHPTLATDNVKRQASSLFESNPYGTCNVHHWTVDTDELKVVLLGVSDSKQSGVVTGYNGGS